MSKGFVDSLMPALSVRSIVFAIWKQRMLVAMLWVAGAVVSVVIVSRLPSVYHAEAVILVESQKIPENFVMATVQTALESRLDGLKQQVLGKDKMWSLIEELDLYPKERRSRTREEVLAMMQRDISIKLERNWSATRPGAFRISFETENLHAAAEVANRVGNFFINENLRERAQEASGTSEFLSHQLEDAKKKLLEQEVRLREFKDAYNGELPEQEAGLLATMGQGKAELLGIQESVARAEQNKLMLQSSLATTEDSVTAIERSIRRRHERAASAGGAAFPTAEPLSELDRKRAELAAMQLRYTDRHPAVRRLKAEIAQIEKEDGSKPAVHVGENASSKAAAATDANADLDADPLTDPSRENMLTLEKQKAATLRGQIAVTDREISDLDQRRQSVVRELGGSESHIQRIPIREQQLAEITRDYDTSKANYHSLFDKKLAADTATEMELREKAERFVMLDAAQVPEKPIRPKRVLLGAAGVSLSLLLALLAAFVRELKRNAFLGEWELPPGTVVLGTVPEMTTAIPSAAAACCLALGLLLGQPLHAQQFHGPNVPVEKSATERVATQTEVAAGRVQYRIGEGDILGVEVYKEPDASTASVPVRLDGKITVALLGEMAVTGLTPRELEQRLTAGYAEILRDPHVTVTVKEIHSQKVYLVGEVKKEGPIRLEAPITVLQALAEAGGVTVFAKRKKMYVLRTENDQRLILPFNYDEVVRGKNIGQNVILEPGDTIVVPH